MLNRRRWLTGIGNYILKSNLHIGVQNITLKSLEGIVVSSDNVNMPMKWEYAVGFVDGSKILRCILKKYMSM